MNPFPIISCIICTYNREDFILQCLDAMSRQTLNSNMYEVIVVDNNSTDTTAELVKGFIKKNSSLNVIYAFEKEQGLSCARNAGAKIARSNILTYIDDDAIADSNLLEEVLRVFELFSSAGCVGGKIDLALPQKLPWWYTDNLAGYYSKFSLFTTSIKKISNLYELPYGANFSVAQKALFDVGGFSTRLGRKGNDFSGGEETELAYRIAANGYDLYYNPFAIVTHHIKEERLNLNHMIKSAKSSARVWVYMERKLMRSNMGIRWDLQNMIKDIIKLLFYVGRRNMAKRFRYFLQALHNYEKVKLKMLR